MINMKRLFFILFAFLVSIILYSCVEKFDINEFDLSDTSGNVTGDTIYVKLSPDWEGFNRPQDIMIGKEPFIYIADTDNDRVVMMNLDGEILGTRSIKKPVALAQDYELKLIVCAKYDTLINNQPITLNAVYKIDLFAANHQIENAPIEIIIPATTTDLNNPDRDFTGTAVFYDNSYLVARKGPNNGTVFNPDNSILQYTPTYS